MGRKLRTGKVVIAGIDYIPPIPNKKEVIEKLKEFEKSNQIH